ncbi:MAG: hypothetical protein ACRYGF_07915 [Janthinobacterium lividum]
MILFAAQAAAAQNAAATAATPHALIISILEGEGELNDVRARTAREPIVQVEDENHKPVAGALVLFALPSGNSPAATFSGLSNLTVRTGADGRAIGRGFKVTRQTGNFQIQVVATAGALQAQIMIHEMNFAKGGKLARVKDYSANHATLTTTVVGLASFAAAASAIAVTSQPGGTVITAGSGFVGR